MKRNKTWWKRLNRQERSELVQLERANNKYSGLGGMLPDDCGECTYCGNPCIGGGLCPYDLNRLIELENKANNKNG